MAFPSESIMTRLGISKGRELGSGQIRIEDQASFPYVYGPFEKPVIHADPGSVLTIETHDAFEGKLTSESDMPAEKLGFPYLNPQTGPVYINGAQKGDCLAVHIRSIKPRGPQPVGTTCLIKEFGGLVGTGATAMLNDPLPERVKKMHVDEDGVRWNDDIVLPYEPFIGTIGVAPEIEAISSLQPDYYGGNMDLPDVAPGSIIYLPVNVDGAHLYMGDCHAIQGDGEVSGVALEIPATVEVYVDLIKDYKIAWPRLETEEFLMSIGCARPLEDAARIAYRELIHWFSSIEAMDKIESYMFLTQCAKVRLGNMVDPKYCMGASVSKRYFKG